MSSTPPRSTPGIHHPLRAATRVIRCALVLAATFALVPATGCLSFKPKPDPARHFVLAPTLTNAPAPAAAAPTQTLGLWPVTLPAYLMDSRLAIRRGPTEVRYADHLLWSERLDHGIQRVLRQNLSTLLSTDQIRLSNWRRDQVARELAIEFSQFDVDDQGTVRLEATWRVTDPGGTRLAHSGHTRLEQPGQPPGQHPDAAVASLSAALAELTRRIGPSLHGD